MSGGGGGGSPWPWLRDVLSLIVEPRPGVLLTPEPPGASGQGGILGSTVTRRETSFCSVVVTTRPTVSPKSDRVTKIFGSPYFDLILFSDKVHNKDPQM